MPKNVWHSGQEVAILLSGPASQPGHEMYIFIASNPCTEQLAFFQNDR